MELGCQTNTLTYKNSFSIVGKCKLQHSVDQKMNEKLKKQKKPGNVY
jgi:hypothetical protein